MQGSTIRLKMLHIQKVILIFIILVGSNFANAGICEPEVIARLEQLGIPLTVNNNKLLLGEIESRYGNDVKQELLKRHPGLQSEDSILDLATLNWVLTEIDDIGLPRYLYNPFSNNFDTINNELFATFVQKEPATYPIFNSENQYEKFKRNLLDNRDVNIMVYSSIHNLSEEKTAELYNQFVEKFTDKTHIKFVNEEHENPIIHIVGHGSAGDDAIYDGSGKHLFTFEVLDQLKKMNIPNNATIKLDFCWSACKTTPSELTKSQAMEYINNRDFESLFGELDESFYQSFLDDVSEQLPDFRGSVFGYRGTVMTSIKDDVISLNGEKGRYYAVELTLTDGTILFKKDDMSVSTKVE